LLGRLPQRQFVANWLAMVYRYKKLLQAKEF
jgi:hypothetical protein